MSGQENSAGVVVAPVPERPGCCRRCSVTCDKVVYPAGCVESGCERMYSYEEHGRRYIGCLEKVFRVEIDLELFLAAQRARGGYGGLRVQRDPLPICRTSIEETYPHRAPGACVNPDFRFSAPHPEFTVQVTVEPR